MENIGFGMMNINIYPKIKSQIILATNNNLEGGIAMKEFDRIKDLVYDEIEQISYHNQLDKDSVCVIGELVDILKDIATVEMFEEGIYVPENEYSLASGGYSRGGNQKYYGGNSYRNNGYTRRGGRSGYSRDDAKDHMIMKLESLMNDAQDEHDR